MIYSVYLRSPESSVDTTLASPHIKSKELPQDSHPSRQKIEHLTTYEYIHRTLSTYLPFMGLSIYLSFIPLTLVHLSFICLWIYLVTEKTHIRSLLQSRVAGKLKELARRERDWWCTGDSPISSSRLIKPDADTSWRERKEREKAEKRKREKELTDWCGAMRRTSFIMRRNFEAMWHVRTGQASTCRLHARRRKKKKREQREKRSEDTTEKG